MLNNPKLIIFDNDGVLIDSEIIWHKVNAIEMTRLGFPIKVEQSIDFFSNVTKDEFEKLMLQKFGKTLSDEDVIAIGRKTEESYPTELTAINGTPEVLQYLEQRHVKKCIASNGDNEYVNATLNLTNLVKYFQPDDIFTSTMVKNRKPAPDVFLKAAKHFNVNPTDCLVIEDHILGIAAAKAANIPVVGFLGASHAKNPRFRDLIHKANPTLIVQDMIELLNIFKKMFD